MIKAGEVGFAASLVPWGVMLLAYFDVVCLS